jgi:predicted MFS family arabinose efflux permease
MKRNRDIVLIPTLFGVLFLTAVDNQMLIPLLPSMARDLNVSFGSIALLFSVYAFTGALVNLVIGPLTDRFGRLPFLRAALLLFAVLAFLTFRSTQYSEIVALRAFTGLAGAVLSTCTASLVGDLFPYHRRGRVMGIVLSAYFLALILGVPLGAWVAEYWEWHTVFLLTAILAGVLFLRSLLLSGASSVKRAPDVRTVFRAYPGLFTKAQTLGGLLTSFLISGATLAFLTYVSAHLDARFGATPVQISWVFVISGFGALGGSALAGGVSDKLGKRSVFLLANTCLVVPLLFVSLPDLGLVLISLFLAISFLIASRQTALQTIQTELIKGDQRGAFIGLRNGVSQLGISSGVLVAGLLYSNFSYFSVTLFAALLTLLASLVFSLTVREPESPPTQTP